MNEIGTEEKIPVQEISIPEVVKERIFPIIDRYQRLLKKDVESLAHERDYRLGEISQEDLDSNLENLQTLKGLLEEYIQNPAKFKVVHSSKSYDNGDRYLLKLKRPSDLKKRPKKEEEAITELSFCLVLGRVYEEREERIRSAGLTRSPEEAVSRLKEEAPKEISLTLSTDKVYWEEDLPGPRINRQSGIVISSSSQEGLMSQGVIYCGATPHYTVPLREKALSHEECVALREYVLEIFEKE